MATLVLAAAGSAIGASIGGSVLGISAAVIGQAVGAQIGRSIDQALFGPTQKVSGPRLDGSDVQTVQEGGGLAVIDGRARVAGTVIWATRLLEVTKTTKEGGKGGGPKVEATEYTYFANFAIALTDCRSGPLRHLGRVWAEGKLLDTSKIKMRFYKGTETQNPDPLIVAKDGAAPAYRGISYVVFERMPIADYGRRIPQLTFEVWGQSGEMEELIQGVDLIPAATEFGYSPSIVRSTGDMWAALKSQPSANNRQEAGGTIRENAIRDAKTSDWQASIDLLEGVLPNCKTVALVVSWFGTDVRASLCQIEPRVEISTKYTVDREWRAAGLTRSSANRVTYIDGMPAFGSSPDDKSVMDAIRDLRARGFRVVLYPFIMMDVKGSSELVVINPGAESGTSGWTVVQGKLGVRDVSPAPYAGGGFFYGPNTGAVRAYQDVQIPSGAIASVDQGGVSVEFSWMQASWHDNGDDSATFNVEFLDQDGNSLGAEAGPALSGITPMLTWRSRIGLESIPAAARQIRVWMRMQRSQGSNLDGYLDEFSMRLVGSSNAAAPVGSFPWRGRISAPASVGSVQAQVDAFLGTSRASHFPANGSGLPSYTGPNEWSYRRFILHLAALARNAGGVDAFLVGSELVGLTTSTDTPGTYPFVDGLVDLAASVKSLLPAARVSYAADWSEYHSHRNGAEVHFHMDPLWSSPNVDFVGIDNYLPISDWRPGTGHADYDPANGVTSAYNLDYLKGQIEGGEYWDYYYADQAARESQTRTPISDGLHGEDWVYRQKAIRDWHGSAHRNRPGGVRDAEATAWVPGSKPVWFTEYGCPAVNLGANQPNVFMDANSSESALPYFSNGVRDDFMQRQYIRAMAEWWRDNGGATVDPANMFVWSWDARPFPEFPRRTDIWSDGDNWRRGHWLNGRAGNAPAAETIKRRLETYYDFPASKMDLSMCFGQADGLVIPGPVSFRQMMGTWETALRLDTVEFGGVFKVASRAAAVPYASYTMDDLVEVPGTPLYSINRTSLEDTPRVAVVRYSDTDLDYEAKVARAAIREQPGQAEPTTELALVSDLERMTNTANMILRSAADERETLELMLPPSSGIKPGHVFTFTPRGGKPVRFIADQVTSGEARKVKGTLFSSAVFASVGGPARAAPAKVFAVSETVAMYLLDLPVLPALSMADHQGVAVLNSTPWPGGVDLYRSTDSETGFSINLRTGLSATVGVTDLDLPPGRVGTWSNETLEVVLSQGALISRSDADVLEGANAMAIEHAPGLWEVVQFRDAALVAADRWQLKGLLRGQLGTEWVRDSGGLAAGARVVFLDAATNPVNMSAGDIGREFHWRAVPFGRDPSEVATVAHTFSGAGRRPYSPALFSASVTDGLLSASWIRRTRVEGDQWPEFGDVPLVEAFERYLLEVGPIDAPVLSVEVSDVTTIDGLDVSAVSGLHEVRVSQISETYGPGTAARVSAVF